MATTNNPIGRIMLKNVRLSFPALFKAEAFNGTGEAKFKATLLVEKGSAQDKEVEAKILAVLKDKFPTKADAILKQIRNNPNKFCYADGETKSYDGYEGMMALSAKSKTRPTVIDADRTPLTEEDGKPYPGCYVNASIDLFTYENSGIGVSASLRGVQFVRDGDAFSGSRPAASDEFEEVTDGAGADDFA